MRPSLLNAPFDPKEFQRRMDEMTRVKHGFVTKVVAPPSTVIAVKAKFHKWPAYVTPFTEKVIGFGGCFGHGVSVAVGRQQQDGIFEYISYLGNSRPYTGSIFCECEQSSCRMVPPGVCKWLIEHGCGLSSPDNDEQIQYLLKQFVILTLNEWQTLPDSEWPDCG